MIDRRSLIGAVAGLAGAGSLAIGRLAAAAEAGFRVSRSDEEWRRMLTPAQYAILRREGTEPPGSSPLDHEFRPGRYDCVGCGQALFSSQTKFDSHTGWPSFWQPLPDAVGTSSDSSFLMTRTAVHCSNCAGHLGHVFDDGPKPTGLRYCMNGTVLSFHPAAA
ncbi:MAG: peptide-methionine (R)-S-oxide reductase MsrB [Alphaproteobacteria bacterium]|nr:peptide-methionine (R)-S-oxide reductase MsrB [Alphaproteobacteria bacterium]